MLSCAPPSLNIVIVWRSSFHTLISPHARLTLTAACLKNANWHLFCCKTNICWRSWGKKESLIVSWSKAFLVLTFETRDDIMPTSLFLKEMPKLMLLRKNSFLFLIYSSIRLELTLSATSCFVGHWWNIDVTAKNTFFSPLFYLYWNHKLSYIYISFIEVFHFYGFVSGFNFEK